MTVYGHSSPNAAFVMKVSALLSRAAAVQPSKN